MPRPTLPGKSSPALMLASIAIIVGGLYFAREFLIPVALSVLLAFLLAPLVTRLERIGLGRIPSVIAVVLAAFMVLTVLGWVVTDQLIELTHRLPQYRGNIQAKIERLRASAGTFEQPTKILQEISQEITRNPATTHPASQPVTQPLQATADALPRDPADEVERQAIRNLAGLPTTQPISVRPVEPTPTPFQFLHDNISPFLDPLATAGLVIVFVVFMLLQHDDLRDRLIRLVSGGQLTITTQAMSDAAERISRYLLMQLFVNITYGVPIAVGLYFIGVPNAILWGLLATVLRFLPYIGPWIAASFPILLSLAAFKGFTQLGLTVALFIVIEMISNNVVEPWLYGSSTGLSASAIVISAAFWTWIWGPIGLLLATPLTVCLVVLGRYVPQLQFLDILLGDQPVLSPPKRVYQRLLAQDAEEASDVVDDYLENSSLSALYDGVLLPALALAEQDRHHGQLDNERYAFVLENLREILDDMAERHQIGPVRLERSEAETGDGSLKDAACVICLPARDEADEICGIMLVHLLQQAGCPARYLPALSLASEMVDAATQQKNSLICISALPPSAVAHARYLCKRLRARLPDTSLLVGLWTARVDASKTRMKLSCNENDAVVNTLADAVAKVQPLVATLRRPADALNAMGNPSIAPT